MRSPEKSFSWSRKFLTVCNYESSSNPAEIIAELEGIIQDSPMTIFEIYESLILYYLSCNMPEKIKKLLQMHDTSMKKNTKHFKNPLPPSNDLRQIKLSDWEKEQIINMFSNNSAHIAAVYPVDRYYNDLLQVHSSMLIIQLRRRFLQKSNDDILACYEDVAPYLVLIGKSKDFKMLNKKNIQPIIIPRKCKKNVG